MGSNRIQHRHFGTGLLALLFGLTITSCAWNKSFLEPERIPAIPRTGKSINHATGDTTLIHLSGETLQPTFTHTNGDTVAMPYSMGSVWFGDPKAQLYGLMMKPKTSSDLPLVTLLFLHGNGGNAFTEYAAMVPFVERGFQAFIFDYSGYGLSGGKATRTNVLRDTETALAYVKARPDVKGTPLVIYGQSMGGHTAALLAGEVKDTITPVVIEGGFTTFRAIAKAVSHTGPLPYLVVKEGPRTERSLEEFKGPLMIIHSPDDEVVPFAMGKELFSWGNEPKQFHAIKGRHIQGPLLQPDSIATWIRGMVKPYAREDGYLPEV